MYQQYNPLQGFTVQQLQYLYGETEPGTVLHSNIASMLGAHQQSMQDRIQREHTNQPKGPADLLKVNI